jgi:hypothetical protein
LQAIERGRATSEVFPEDESAAPEGRISRLKAASCGVLAALRNAWANGLGRLRRKPPADVARNDKEPAKNEGRTDRRRDNAPVKEAEAVAGPAPRRWRSLPGYAAAILVGAVAAGSGAYFFLSGLLTRQATEISQRQEEIAEQKALLAGYERILVLETRKIEEEQARLAGQEKALALDHKMLGEDQAKLDEARKRLALLQQERTKGIYRPDAVPSPGNKASSGSAGTGGCDVRAGNVGATLKACIDEFNRASR